MRVGMSSCNCMWLNFNGLINCVFLIQVQPTRVTHTRLTGPLVWPAMPTVTLNRLELVCKAMSGSVRQWLLKFRVHLHLLLRCRHVLVSLLLILS